MRIILRRILRRMSRRSRLHFITQNVFGKYSLVICSLLDELESPAFAFKGVQVEISLLLLIIFPIHKFFINLPTSFTCMSGFIVMVTPDSRLLTLLLEWLETFMVVCLMTNVVLLNQQTFFSNHSILGLSSLQTSQKTVINRSKSGFPKYLTSNLIKFNIEVDKELVNITLNFPVMLLIICRLSLMNQRDPELAKSF